MVAVQSPELMSLKIFHFFFIMVTALVSFGIGTWRYRTAEVIDSAVVFQAGGSLVVGVGLVVYGVRFIMKYRGLSNL